MHLCIMQTQILDILMFIPILKECIRCGAVHFLSILFLDKEHKWSAEKLDSPSYCHQWLRRKQLGCLVFSHIWKNVLQLNCGAWCEVWKDFFPVLAKYCRWESNNVNMVVAYNWQIKQFKSHIMRRPEDRNFTILYTVYAEDFYGFTSV